MFNEPFDRRGDEPVQARGTNGLGFEVDLAGDLRMIVGVSSRVRMVVTNLTASA
jgi:hypothetical protein